MNRRELNESEKCAVEEGRVDDNKRKKNKERIEDNITGRKNQKANRREWKLRKRKLDSEQKRIIIQK